MGVDLNILMDFCPKSAELTHLTDTDKETNQVQHL